MESRTPAERVKPTYISDLLDALHHQATQPLGNDRRSGAFAKAVAYLLDTTSYAHEMNGQDAAVECVLGDPDLSSVIMDIVQTRNAMYGMPDDQSYMAPSHLANLLMRAVQADQLRRDTPYSLDYAEHTRYPQDYTSPAAWLHTIKEILRNPDRAEMLSIIMYNYDLLSNIPQRAAALELGGRALQQAGLLASNPLVYHIGCSQQDIEKKLVLKRRLPWPRHQYRPLQAVQAETLQPFPKLQTYINQRLNRHWTTRLHVGFDIRDTNDPLTKFVAAACRFYPSELLDPVRLAEVAVLAKSAPKTVRFLYGDFADYSLQSISRDLGVSPDHAKADIAFFSFSLYQQSTVKQGVMIQKAIDCLTDNGWVFILDFVHRDPKAPHKLRFEKDWSSQSYLCRLLAIAKTDPTRTPQELFVFENGRVERVRLGMALVATAGNTAIPFSYRPH